MALTENSFLPIKDYGLIGDCHSSALVSKSGSIDWCCMPRFDSASCFGRILDWEKGGFCQILPTTADFCFARRYLGESMVLESRFQSEEGEVSLIDFFAMRKGGQRHPYRQLLRIIKPIRGSMEIQVKIQPRFDYGATKPWIRKYAENAFSVMGGCDGILISSNVPLNLEDRHQLFGVIRLKPGQNGYLSITYARPEDLGEGTVQIPSLESHEERLQETLDWWKEWIKQGNILGAYSGLALRSAMVLKCLCYAPTGAIVAAPTTSLPEGETGIRNWDYRYSWVRDSCFSVRVLGVLGFVKEADGFRRFIERSSAGSVDELQIMFGVDGGRHLFERSLDYLEGYRGAKPVRVGNAAHQQLQLDVYGELLVLAWRWFEREQIPDDDYWLFLETIVNRVADIWERPDHGIWEVRSEPRHFVFSKVMCWVTMDRGIRLASALDRKQHIDRWTQVKDKIEHTIEEQGYDSNRGVYIQAFGYPLMDASLLLLPFFGYINYKDPKMIRTVDLIRRELTQNGLLRRYPPFSDHLEGNEGVFIACTFWLVSCLARQGEMQLAQQIFDNALQTGNDLGLFSEEYCCEKEEMLGNFPKL